jgi:hypothetical protein
MAFCSLSDKSRYMSTALRAALYASAKYSSSILHSSFTLTEYHLSNDWRLDMKPKYNPDLMYLVAVIIAVFAMLRT